MINSQSNLNNSLPSPQCSNKKQLSPDSDRYRGIIINFSQGVGSDIGIIARISLIVRNLVKQGFWQYANLANKLLGVILI